MGRLILLAFVVLTLRADNFNIVWDGSSTTAGTGFRPAVDAALRAAGHTVVATTTASSGRQMGAWPTNNDCGSSWTQVCQAPANVDPLLNANPGKQIYWSQNPTNDMAGGAVPGAQGYARHVDLIARRQPGWIHMASAVTPRAGPSDDAARVAYNSALIAGCLDAVVVATNSFGGRTLRCSEASVHDYIIDTSTDSRLGPNEVGEDPTWVPDGAHLSAAGNAILRDLTIPAMLDTLAPAASGMFPLPGPIVK
jgi:hypothetical protein